MTGPRCAYHQLTWPTNASAVRASRITAVGSSGGIAPIAAAISANTAAAVLRPTAGADAGEPVSVAIPGVSGTAPACRPGGIGGRTDFTGTGCRFLRNDLSTQRELGRHPVAEEQPSSE